MAFSIISEILARIEHKLDLILTAIKYHESPGRMPMHFFGHVCPVCDKMVDYQVDLLNNVVSRRCDCTTGKVLPTMPLFPLTAGVTDGNAASNADTARSEGEGNAKNRRRR